MTTEIPDLVKHAISKMDEAIGSSFYPECWFFMVRDGRVGTFSLDDVDSDHRTDAASRLWQRFGETPYVVLERKSTGYFLLWHDTGSGVRRMWISQVVETPDGPMTMPFMEESL